MNFAQYASAPAIITDTCTLTYAELDAHIERCCAELQALGVKTGTRVAFIASSSWQTVALYFALFRLNATACPINFRFPEPRVQKLLQEFEPLLTVEPEKLFSSSVRCKCERSAGGIAVLMPTSGSSGPQKIAALSYGSLYLSADGSMQKLPLDASDRWLLSLPLFHVSGLALLFRAFIRGMAVIISTLPLQEAISRFGVTFLSLVPTQLFRLCKALPAAPAHLKGILIGGAPLSPTLLEEARGRGYKIFSSYGMTETCAQITLDTAPTMERGYLTCGKPLPYRQLKLSPEGEILVKGQTLFSGYWHKETGATLPLDSEGWFHTKDRGELSEDGRLIVLGRKDRLFISGGENIFPEEIESALLALPDIFEAYVFPQPDAEFGEVPHAFINSGDENFSEEQILTALRKTLPGYMLPRSVLQMPAERHKNSYLKMLKF